MEIALLRTEASITRKNGEPVISSHVKNLVVNTSHGGMTFFLQVIHPIIFHKARCIFLIWLFKRLLEWKYIWHNLQVVGFLGILFVSAFV